MTRIQRRGLGRGSPCVPLGQGCRQCPADPGMLSGAVRQAAPRVPSPSFPQAGTLGRGDFKAEQGALAAASRRSPQHPSPLRQRHQNHLKIAPPASAPCQPQLLSSPGLAAMVLSTGRALPRRGDRRTDTPNPTGEPSPAAAPRRGQPHTLGAPRFIAPWGRSPRTARCRHPGAARSR